MSMFHHVIVDVIVIGISACESGSCGSVAERQYESQ